MMLRASQQACPAVLHAVWVDGSQKGGAQRPDASRKRAVGPPRGIVSHRYLGDHVLGGPTSPGPLPDISLARRASGSPPTRAFSLLRLPATLHSCRPWYHSTLLSISLSNSRMTSPVLTPEGFPSDLSVCLVAAVLQRVNHDDRSALTVRISRYRCFLWTHTNQDASYPHIHKLLVSLSPQTPLSLIATTILFPFGIDYYVRYSYFSGRILGEATGELRPYFP
ncbi:hypothetical protein ES707_01870 [subsurface metagenome]